MNASAAETQNKIPAAALEVAAGLLDRFDQADAAVQFELPALLKDLMPLIGDLSPEELRDRLVQRLEELLAADEWSASDEAGERHTRLYRVAVVLQGVEEIADPVGEAVRNDAARNPTEGWSIEVLRRARTLGAEAPLTARQAIVAQLPSMDWDAPEQAAAIARARAELIASLGDDAEEMPLGIDDALCAYSNESLADARRALGSWLSSAPSASAVQRLLRSGPVIHPDLADDIAQWAKRQGQAALTPIARSLLSVNRRRARSFGAICGGPVDERNLATYAGKRIRGLSKVEDRTQVANTVGGHTFSDENARAQLVRIIAFLLKPGMPKSDMQVVAELLPALGEKPLLDPEPLTTAIRRAQGRWDLKLTEAQGRQLVALGVRVQKGWFGERIAKRVWKLIPKL